MDRRLGGLAHPHQARARVRRRRRAFDRPPRMACGEGPLLSRCWTRWPARVAVMHPPHPPAPLNWPKAVNEALHPVSTLTTEFSSVMAVHTGPGFVGLAVCHDE